ncbi:MAG: ATP-binding cassette domain-containing protein [Phycisphaerales bacterium]|nr:ATP-binding cassette domain-containing protein [Phycisphaerales bacterium]
MVSNAPSSVASAPLLRVEDLRTWFRPRRRRLWEPAGILKAVDGVSLEIAAGRTLGVVGESGCGKSTLARSILRLIPATSGRVQFDGRDVYALRPRALRQLRRDMQMIFQDPVGSLNPRLSIETLVGEALGVHGLARTAPQRRDRVVELLLRVGLPADALTRYPHEFSGGQRQRIGIARALALNPRLIVCDEPVSALDVSIQAQILNLLVDLQDELGLCYLFIAHDLAVVRRLSHTVAVMYLGRIVEHAATEALFLGPRHPYTQALLHAAPTIALHVQTAGRTLSQPRSALPLLHGEPPSPLNPPVGCVFHPRCPMAEERCRSERPELRLLSPGHEVACHYMEQTAASIWHGRQAYPTTI